MKFLMIAATIAALPAGMALADADCHVPRDRWQPRAALSSLAAAQGWTVEEIDEDDGCYEIEARTADGRRIEAKINPETLAVLEVEDKGDEARAGRGARDPSPAGAAPPPPNGLFGGSTPPKVTID